MPSVRNNAARRVASSTTIFQKLTVFPKLFCPFVTSWVVFNRVAMLAGAGNGTTYCGVVAMVLLAVCLAGSCAPSLISLVPMPGAAISTLFDRSKNQIVA